MRSTRWLVVLLLSAGFGPGCGETVEDAVADAVSAPSDVAQVPDVPGLDDVMPSSDLATPDEDTPRSGGDDVVAPEDDVVAPEDDVVAPEDDVVTPEDDVVAPEDDVVTPEDDVVTPEDDVVTPEEDVVTPEDDVVTPEDDVVTPEDDVWEDNCGICAANASCQNTDDGPACACDEGFEVADGACVDIDECADEPGPCEDNRTCENTEGSWVCECLEGAFGEDCAPCDCGDGDCDDGLDGDGSCTCGEGWTGDACDVDVDECALAPCGNGECVNQPGTFACQCEPGWTGDACDADVDECIDNPCAEQVPCTNTQGGFECACPAGKTGKLCDQEIDDCAGLPCANGGTCLDEDDGFSCVCPPGFEGALCESETDECSPNPCLSGAQCVDQALDFECLCGPGTFSKVCVPCTCGFGVCDDGPGGTGNCVPGSCTPGFWGTDCQYVCAALNCAPGGFSCNGADGTGLTCDACNPGWFGVGCTQECPPTACVGVDSCEQATGDPVGCDQCEAGFFGEQCESLCAQGNCVGPVACDKATGEDRVCTACGLGWSGTDCEETDEDGDGVPTGADACPEDPQKTAVGECGCGQTELEGGGCGANPVITPLSDVVGSIDEPIEVVFTVWDNDDLAPALTVEVTFDGEVLEGGTVELIPPACAYETTLALGSAEVLSAKDGEGIFGTNSELLIHVGPASQSGLGVLAYASPDNAFEGGETFEVGFETKACGAQKVTMVEPDPGEDDPVGTFVLGDAAEEFGAGEIATNNESVDLILQYTLSRTEGEWTLRITPGEGQSGTAEIRVDAYDGPPNEAGTGRGTRRFFYTAANLPVIEQSPPPFVFAPEGSTVTLTCLASGNPAPQISWSHNGEVIADADGSHLVLEGVDAETTGEYVCTASNPEGTVSADPTYIEIDVPPVVTGPATVDMIEDRPKTVSLQVEDVHTPASEIVITPTSDNAVLFPPGSIQPSSPCEGLRRVTILSAWAVVVDDGITWPLVKDVSAEIDFRVGGHTIGTIDELVQGAEPVVGTLDSFTVCGNTAVQVYEDDAFGDDLIGPFVPKRTVGMACSSDAQCWSDKCETTCQFTGEEPTESEPVTLSGGGVTMQLTYVVEVEDKTPHSIALHPAKDQYGSAQITLEVSDATATVTHVMDVTVEPACETAELPTVEHGSMLCFGGGDTEKCSLRCDFGYAFSHPGERIVEPYPDPEAACLDGHQWTWLDELGALQCRYSKPAIAPIANQVVVEDGVLVVPVLLQDPDTPVLPGTFSVSASGTGPLSGSSGGKITVDSWCGTQRRIVLEKIDVIKAHDGTFGGKLEVRLEHEGKEIFFADEMDTGDVLEPNLAIDVCGVGRINVLEIDDFGPFSLPWDADGMGWFKVGKVDGHACEEDWECHLGTCQNNWCDANDGTRMTTHIHGDSKIQIYHRVEDVGWNRTNLRLRPGPDQNGASTVTVSASDGDSHVSTTFSVQVKPACEADAFPTTGEFASFDLDDCGGPAVGKTCATRCAVPGKQFTESGTSNPVDPPVAHCNTGETWSISYPTPGACTTIPEMTPPAQVFAEDPAFEACGAFEFSLTLDSICPDTICKFSGGSQSWVWMKTALDAELAIHNRRGLKERLATGATPETVNEDGTGKTSMVFENSVCKTQIGCLEDQAYAWVDGLLQVAGFGTTVTVLDAFVGGELTGGRAAGKCPSCPSANEWKSGGARLDAYLAIGPFVLQDGFELPGKPLVIEKTTNVIGKAQPGQTPCKSLKIGGIITIDGCLEVSASVGVEIDMAPAFALPDYFGARVTPTPFAGVSTTGVIDSDLGVVKVGLALDMALADLRLVNDVDLEVQTGACQSTSKGTISLSGQGRIDLSVLQGSLTGSACAGVGALSKCASVQFFEVPGWSTSIDVYEWDAGELIEF